VPLESLPSVRGRPACPSSGVGRQPATDATSPRRSHQQAAASLQQHDNDEAVAAADIFTMMITHTTTYVHYTGLSVLPRTPSEELEEFAGAKFYCPHAPADSN